MPPHPAAQVHVTGPKSVGIATVMFRNASRELSKMLPRSKLRAASGGGHLRDGAPSSVSSVSSASEALLRPPACRQRGPRSVTTKATAWLGAREQQPAAESNYLPSLSLQKSQIDQLREQGSAKLRGLGTSVGCAKRRSDHKKQQREVLGAPETLHLLRATAGDNANDLASVAPTAASAEAPSTSSAAHYPHPATPEAHEARGDGSNGAAEPAAPAAPERLGAALAAADCAVADDEDFDAGFPEEEVREAYRNTPPADVLVVNTPEGARAAAARLMATDLADRVFACDTEVADIDVAKHSPCCHGRVICFSIYAGPDVHFGDNAVADDGGGSGEAAAATAPPRCMLWVDTYLDGEEGREGEVAEIVDAFRPFFEATDRRKVWHNYSFDRHVLERAGLRCAGFGGDTMHMARMWDSSRVGRGGYGLEALSCDNDLMGAEAGGSVRGKVSMKKLFGRRNVKKDGTEGKLTVLPPVHELQRCANTRWQWVNYSAYDAKSTWDLHSALAAKLRVEAARVDEAVAGDYARVGVTINTLWDVYCHFWRPFGELLTDMEDAGMAVDRDHLAAAEERAVREESESRARFRSWAASRVPDAKYMNVGSGQQVSQLLFAGVFNKKDVDETGAPPGIPLVRTLKAPNQREPEEGKKAKKTMEIRLHGVWGEGERSPLAPEAYTPAGVPACSTPVLKSLAGRPGRARKALAELDALPAAAAAEGIEAVRDDWEEESAAPWSTDDAEISKLQLERQEAVRRRDVGELEAVAVREGYGRLFSKFGSIYEGLRACAAVDSLVDASAIDTLLSNFIVPLQSSAISKPDAAGVHRVHCSLNINTETGRLSARRPNLQNQPALEKDRYRVRKAFTADVAAGKTLIVADYGQLELRILAHMAGCKSMIEAFRLGGDFHSRTALGMYDYIQAAVAAGDCLLEWDGAGGAPPPAPLLKDKYGVERRKAKVLNFSIAYGKTAHGLSKDWGTSLKEAEETVKRWYHDRPEVLKWQEQQHQEAAEKGYVCTLLGRRRNLPDAAGNTKNRAARAHALRAAINTPIQGSAADVATAAMVRINGSERLEELGWRLLLQVHDEVILEGPRESAAEAEALVVECMRSPFSGQGQPLLVDLAVDSKHADTWYDAK